MKVALSLVPFAAGLGAFAIAVGILISQGAVLGTWLFAAFLLAHGLIQLVFLLPRPAVTPDVFGGADWPFDMAGSWTIGRFGLSPAIVRGVGRALLVAIVAGYALAALATIGWLVPASWWAPLVFGPTLASIVLLGLFFSASLILGLVIDAALLWVVFASGWSPGGLTAPV